MTQRQIAALACKLLGLYAIFNSLNTLVYTFVALGSMLRRSDSILSYLDFFKTVLSPTGEIFLGLVPGFVAFCIGVALIVFANGIAIFLSDDAPAEVITIDARSLQAIAFSIAGIFIMMQAIPVVAQSSMESYLVRTSFHSSADEYGPLILIVALIKIPIGLYLLFGARGLVRLLPDIGRDSVKQSE